MRPFNPDPITDRSRELFGTYMRRYEYVPSMSAFDALISDRRRELYGEYRSRWSKRKVGSFAGGFFAGADGLNWVTITTSPAAALKPTINDIALYQIYFFLAGGWAGNGEYRVLIDGQKVYPFGSSEVIVSDTWLKLGTLSTSVRTGEECTIQFRSDNAGDQGPAQECVSYMRYATFE